ncbi:MAG: type II toxin-antitoxin system prevent-host-death family antitoxin [Candidatus Shapirobacteria bacterium]
MNTLGFSFVGSYELRKDLPLLIKSLNKKRGEVVVTQKGKPAAVLLSLKRYSELNLLTEELEEAIREMADKRELQELLREREEIKKGKGKEAEDLFKELGI